MSNSIKKEGPLYDLCLSKNKRGLCAVKFCRGRKVENKRICSKCCKRRRKINDPIGYAYGVTKQNAKRRGKVFTITLEYFTEFCLKTGYIEKKGRKPNSLSIDRINPDFGYINGNIRAMTYGLNSGRTQDDEKHDPNPCTF